MVDTFKSTSIKTFVLALTGVVLIAKSRQIASLTNYFSVEMGIKQVYATVQIK